MYAILEAGSKQYKVSQGDIIEVEKIDVKAKKSVTLSDVLLISDGKDVKVGQPHVKGAKVVADVITQCKAPKVISFKYKRRKGKRWKKGHRQQLTRLEIKEISVK
ncbi:50S ribosomal protein L21 [Candidatus Omnitrophota bacterium]